MSGRETEPDADRSAARGGARRGGTDDAGFEEPGELDVEGHRVRYLATDQPQPGDGAEVEGHGYKRIFNKPETDREAEVAGHAAETTDAGVPVDLATDDEAFEAPGELDVEGHLSRF